MSTKRCRQMTLMESFENSKRKEKSESMDSRVNDDDEEEERMSYDKIAENLNSLEQSSSNSLGNTSNAIEDDQYECETDTQSSDLMIADFEDLPNSSSLEEDLCFLSPTDLEADAFDLEVEVLNRWPECTADLTPSVSDPTHTVMFRLPLAKCGAPSPNPLTYQDKWDSNHVRMPCSPFSLYPIESQGREELGCRWEIICEALTSEINSSVDFENAIMKYNKQYIGRWNFNGFHSFLEECVDESFKEMFFDSLLPKIAALALQLPEICTQPVPLLKKQKDCAITLSQKQVSCLLANAFFCTFPRRNFQVRLHSTRRPSHEYAYYPDINFNRLYVGTKNGIIRRNREKLKCILNYFSRVTSEEPTGSITFHRQYLQSFPNWGASRKDIKEAVICTKGVIETQGHGMLQVDFANRFVGGGVLGRGCVQEEIRFVICPELIVSRLFTECLLESECLIVTGVEQYSKYTGYGDEFLWNGDFVDTTNRDSLGRRYTQLVAIDALHFRKGEEQFKLPQIKRELNKAYVGFYTHNVPCNKTPAVATGNWGCGAYKGNPHLKFLIQLMAAAETNRGMLYFTFGNERLKQELKDMHMFIQTKKLTVGDLWMLLESYCTNAANLPQKSWPNLYDYIYSFHLGLLNH